MKERPDSNGAYPIMCPGYGPGATVDCPLRAIHQKASKREVRPEVTPPVEHKRDRICRQSSVNVPPDAATRYLQELRYKSREWSERFGHDRSQIESYNSVIKDPAKEDVENTARRRIRGFTGAYIAVAFAMVSANLRLTRAFYRAEVERRAKPNAPYKRRTKPFTVITLDNYKPTLPEMDLDGNIIGIERRRPGRQQSAPPRTLPDAA